MKDPSADPAPFAPQELTTLELAYQVRRVRFRPGGQLLCAAGYDAAIHRWKRADGEEPGWVELPPLQAHSGWVEGLEFGGDSTLYSSDSWGRLAAWDLEREAAEPRWQHAAAHDGWIRCLAVSDCGQWLASGGRDGKVRVWNAAEGTLRQTLDGHRDVYGVAFHPAGDALVTADLDGQLRHWDWEAAKVARAVRLEGAHLYDRIQDVPGIRRLFFHKQAAPQETAPQETAPQQAVQLVCAGGDPRRTGNVIAVPTVRLLDWEPLKVARTLELGKDNDGLIYDLLWQPDGYFVAVTSGTPGAGRLIMFRGDKDGDQPFYESKKLFNPHSLAWDPETRTLVVASTNRSSQGNGAVLDKEGNYLGNSSPLHFFQLPGMS